MVFSSNIFILFFLPVTLFIYYLTGSKFKNYVLLAASYIFYAWGAYEFLLILIFSTLIDYFIGLFIHKTGQKKAGATLSIIINLGLLIYFKYSNFFIDEWNHALNTLGMNEIHWIKIALPIGISFFTFHKISYVIDIYRNKAKPLRNFADFALYITLFPQLIAGPIIRFHQIENQIRHRDHTFEKFFDGLWRFSVGLGKKTLLANPSGQIADDIFSLSNNELSSPMAWIGILAYSFQIYFDFSGYSDMAIGIAKMIGFEFPENFNKPYIARSITDFWRRWHITLSSFFRDYVYIPLGGNRKGTFKTYRNLWLVFFLSGLWHGANWTFMFWGAYHGLFLVLERAVLLRHLEKMKVVNHLYAFLLIMIGWVFFRSDSINHALIFIGHMANITNIEFVNIPSFNPKNIFFLTLAAFFSFVTIPSKFMENIHFKGIVMLLLIIYSIVVLSNASYSPFIYFRF